MAGMTQKELKKSYFNPNGTKTLLANGLITLFINGSTVLSNGAKSLPRNPPDCIILDN